MNDWLYIAITALVALVVGGAVGFLIRKSVAEKKIRSAEAEAQRVKDEIIKAAEAKKKEMLVEAKEEILKQRSETERELKERRNDVNRLERRAIQKEENLDRKLDNLDKKEETLNKKIKDMEARQEEVEQIKLQELQKLKSVYQGSVLYLILSHNSKYDYSFLRPLSFYLFVFYHKCS